MLLEEFMPGFRLPAVALLLALTVRAGAAEYDVPKDLDVTGPYTQEATGMMFPEHVLDFERTGVTRYNSDGTEESADYILDEAGRQSMVSVYVYPAPADIAEALAGALPTDELAGVLYMLAEQLFADEEQAIADLHPGAELRDEGDTTIQKQGRDWPGDYALFRYNEDAFGKVQRVDSKLYLFPMVGGKWMVKFRISAPNGNGEAEGERFVRALPWTIRGMKEMGQ
jgi:hypothetical protein